MADDLIALINRLKPVAHVYKFKDERPARVDAFLDVSATLKVDGKFEVLTFWFRWDHDFEGDGVEDWEPVTYILKEGKVIDIQTRTHWTIIRWLTDNPVLDDGERAVLFFSKHGHAPYMQVKSDLGWLKSAFDIAKTRYAVLDFLEVMDERNQYVNISQYAVTPDREPPGTSRAMIGIKILGRKFSAQYYKKPGGF